MQNTTKQVFMTEVPCLLRVTQAMPAAIPSHACECPLPAPCCCAERVPRSAREGFTAQCRAIPASWWAGGLAASAAACTAVLAPMLGLRWYEPLAAVVLALLVAVLAVRALGQTDLNPVSGVGKLSQVCGGAAC